MSDQTPQETERTGYWIDMEQLDALGRLADSCENYVGASRLPLPPAMHVDQMRQGFTQIAQHIKELYQAISGDSPWSA